MGFDVFLASNSQVVVFHVGFDGDLAKLLCFTWVLMLAPNSHIVVFYVGFDCILAKMSCFMWVLMSFWLQVPR